MVNKIDETAIIREGSILGDNVEILEYVVVGAIPTIFHGFERIRSKCNVVIGSNVFIGAHTVICRGKDRDTKIGDNVIIGQQGLIGHDCIISDNVKIMNTVVLNGYVEVGEGTFIGSGAKVRERIKIGKNCYIGMGSNVVKDVPDNAFGYGNPFEIKRYTDTTSYKFNQLRKKAQRFLRNRL